jgi:UDP-N-acetylglucosamine 4,6-dehydratase
MKIVDLAEAIAPGCEFELTGVRPGEKLHECLVASHESRHTISRDRMLVILPESGPRRFQLQGEPLGEEVEYTSDANDEWLGVDDLRRMVATLEPTELGPLAWQ